MNNAGTATIPAGQTFTFANAAVWNNLAGSLFVLPDSAGISNFFANASAFNNAGTVRKTAPPGTATIAVPFNNLGTTEVQTGTLALTGGGSNTGTINLAALTTESIGGTYTFAGGSATGAGAITIGTFNTLAVSDSPTLSNVTVNGGTLTANAGSAFQIGTLAFQNGTVTGPGTVTVTSNLSWTNGIMSGTGITNSNGTSALLARASSAAWTGGR